MVSSNNYGTKKELHPDIEYAILSVSEGRLFLRHPYIGCLFYADFLGNYF